MKKHHKHKSAASYMFLLIIATGFFVLACNSLMYQQQKVDAKKKQDVQLAEIIERANCDLRVKNREGCDDVKPVILSSDKKKVVKVDKKDKMAHLFQPKSETERQAKIADIWHLKGDVSKETKIFAAKD